MGVYELYYTTKKPYIGLGLRVMDFMRKSAKIKDIKPKTVSLNKQAQVFILRVKNIFFKP